ncbi:hypothetical protein ABZW03_09765 [Kitasatospora sp. NPDC004799]|uniref:hypothetical protein n=1 Tax=Kitasatospora sp. NPDC004799 TaxID=3154460 RepID=UPI0033B3DF73
MNHRPTAWTRVGGALLAAAALAPATAAWYLFTDKVPHDAGRYRAYTAAAVCPAGDPRAVGTECVRTAPFTVSDTVVRDQVRNSQFRATLTAPRWTGKVLFGDPGPLLEELKPGDQVDGTVWRGRIVRLERAGVAQATADEPRDEMQFTAAMGTFTALVAVLAGLLGARLFTGRPGTLALGRPIFLWTLLACGAPAVLAFTAGLPWWTVPIAAVPASLLAAEGVRRRYLRRSTGGTTPGGPQEVVGAPARLS